jgi:alpha-tubulin suppressor-like RCC1 family protein
MPHAVAALAVFALVALMPPIATAQTSISAPGYQPTGLAYDETTDVLYVAENSGSRRIYKIDPDTGAVIDSFLAPSLSGMDGRGNPNDLAYDGNGHLFVSDIGSGGSGVVFEVDLGASGGPAIVSQFNLPFRGGAIAFDGTNLYISDLDSSTILITDRAGTTIDTWQDSGLRPAGMFYDGPTGHLFVISIFDQAITQLTTDGSLVATCTSNRAPGVQGLGGVTIVGSRIYVAEASDPDPFSAPQIAGTIHISNLIGSPCNYVNAGTNLFGWGANFLGQLALGTVSSTPEVAPVPVTMLPDVIGLGAGTIHTLAIRKDGTVWTAGHASYGQIGNGSLTGDASCLESSGHECRSTPVQVFGLRGVRAVAGGHLFNIALRGDGSVWAWGHNGDGELGVPYLLQNSWYCNFTSLNCSTVPVQVDGFGPQLLAGHRAVAIAAGETHAMALRADGSLWAWGSNARGQLGDGPNGTTPHAFSPVQAAISNVVSIAAGNGGTDFSVAAKSDGTVWAWGDHQHGTLGNGISLADAGCDPIGAPFCSSPTPVQVPGLANVVRVAAGGTHAAALKSDGTVWTWGNNVAGQLGDGTLSGATCPGGLNVCRTVPVQVVGLTNVIAIRASALYTIALKDDGSLWTWGSTPANQGTLGVGEPGGTTHPIPVPVIDIAQVGWSGSPTSPPFAFGDAAMSAFATRNGHTLAIGAVTGGNLSVRPLEGGTMSNEVTLTFSNVITPGVTTLTRSGSMPQLPSGFSFGDPPTFYDIQTSAVFTGPITLCINFVPSWFPPGTTPTILHFDQSLGTWEPLAPSTITNGANGSTICAPTTSLSPFALVVGDSVAPTLHVTLSAATLSPPNHRLIPVTAAIHVSDDGDANPRVELVSITSTEADAGVAEEDLPNDIQDAAFGTDDREFALRAERSGRGSGRTYTVTYAATDMAGNRSEVSRIVFVPHDRRRR